MSEPVKPEDILPAEFALGLLRGAARKEAAARLETDARLRAATEQWQQTLVALEQDVASTEETLPAALFDKILNRIDAEGLQLPGTRTRRADKATWREIAPGVVSRVLHIDRANNRQSLLIRMAPGSVYHPHAHDADEEAFIVEGDLWFGDLKLGAGDYHIAVASSRHPPGRTVGGCTVHVVTSLSH
jgi:anti-sigma-K factor RskA